MKEFIEKHSGDVVGVLSGWDRVRFRGTIRMLAWVDGMGTYLNRAGVLLKDFGAFVDGKSSCLKKAVEARAAELGRPVIYVSSSHQCKEDLALEIARKDGIKEGLVCVLTAVEPCMSFVIGKDPEKKKLVLKSALRKCLFLYGYLIDEAFGWLSVRIQSWYPFTVQVCVNGREWLGRQMDRAGIRYERRDNCFSWIEDPAKAQALMEGMQRINWPPELERILGQVSPGHSALTAEWPLPIYWSAQETEWATDVMFKSTAALEAIYPPLARGAIVSYGSGDVMRFLGRKLVGQFKGQVQSDFKRRPEGVRVKHRIGANSIKVYDKQGSVLRVETTINDPHDFKTFRTKESDPGGPKDWRVVRRGVADLHRRAEVSQSSNERYLDALAALDTAKPLGEFLKPICRPRIFKGHRNRGLRPWSEEDQALLEVINRGEFLTTGFRNRDLAAHLAGKDDDPRRTSGRISRCLRMLRAHKLIRKIPKTHRYQMTPLGRRIASAVLQAQVLTLQQISRAAA